MEGNNWNTTDKSTGKPLDRPLSYLTYFALAEKHRVFEKSKRAAYLKKRLSRPRYPSNRDLNLELELKELVEADTIARARRANLSRYEDDGGMDVGDDFFDGRPICIEPTNLTRSNTLILGQSRIGKSTGLRHIVHGILKSGQTKVLIFDCKKSNLRDLKTRFEQQNEEFCIIENDEGCINVFEPEDGVHPRDYIPHIAGVLESALEVSTPARRSMEEIIYQIYTEKGIFSDSPDNFPHLGEFREAIVASRKIHKLIKDAIISRVDPILLSSSKIFCHRKGWKSQEILKTNTLWELWEKSEPVQTLLANILLMKGFTGRVSNKFKTSKTNSWPVLAVFDDAQMMLTKDGFVKDMIKVLGETGIVLLCCVQSISDCDPAVIANCGSLFVGRCRFEDFRNMCQYMGLLTYSEMSTIRRHLGVGVFLTQLAGGSQAFLLKFPAKPRNLNLVRT